MEVGGNGSGHDALAEAVLDALPSAILLVDRGRAVYANQRAADILGKPSAELAGADVGELFACAEPTDAQLTTRVRRNGAVTTLGYTVSTVLHEGRKLCAISFRDITDTLRLTVERDRLLQLAAVGEATPTLLHEIRNPLAAIITTVELLLEESAPGAAQDSLHAVLTEARRIALQLDGVGAVGRSLRSHRAQAVDEACRDICAIFAPRAEKAGIFMRWDVPHLPLLPLDPGTVRAILFNLLNNALQACRSGDTIRAHVRWLGGPKVFELTVVDTGSGMSAEVYAHCTDLFYSTKRHGSGIGLALCRSTVEDAGGALQIQSVPGTGTSVVIIVPLAEPPPDEAPPSAKE